MIAARLAGEITGPLSAAAVALGVLVFVTGAMRAVASPSVVAERFAGTLALALEFFLAAGLLHLGNAETFRALAVVAAIVLLRRLLTLGVRLAVGATRSVARPR